MSEEQIKQFIDQATQSLQGGNFQEAMDLAAQAIALDERNSEAYVLRGIALSQLGQQEEASNAFRSAIMFSPYNPKAYYNAAVHYYSLGEMIQAEEMAREAIRTDPKHSGARDLLTRIEGDKKPQTGVGVNPSGQQPYVGDPLSQPPQGSESSGVSDPIPPAGMSAQPSAPVDPLIQQPVAPEQPRTPYTGPTSGPYGQAPTPSGYYRPGYDTSDVHSLQFVANMGKTWDTVGIVTALGHLIISIINIVTSMALIQQMFQDPSNASSMSQAMMGGNMIVSLIGYAFLLGSFVWMIMELVDRRGPWLWLLPYILCCCCGMQSVVQLIYIFKGRN